MHTHSKFATAVSAMDGVEKVPVIDIEGVVYLGGEILVAPFAPPGSGELAAHVRNTIGTNACSWPAMAPSAQVLPWKMP